MFDARTFQRYELALGVLGLTAASVVFVVAMDAVRFHAVAMVGCVCHFRLSAMPLEGWLLVGLGALVCIVILRAVRSLAKHVSAHRSLVGALPVRGPANVYGQRVEVLDEGGLHAFCAGLSRPAVYVSDGLLSHGTPAELRAILAHESHHRRRRDPLRFLLARVVSDAFRPLPPLAGLAERHSALSELAADAAAVRAMGGVQPVAAALARFDEMHAAQGGGIAPERIDQLVRSDPPQSLSPWLLGAAALALAGIGTLTLPMVLLGWHPAPAVPLGLELAAVVAACVPACLAARRVTVCLRPAA